MGTLYLISNQHYSMKELHYIRMQFLFDSVTRLNIDHSISVNLFFTEFT